MEHTYLLKGKVTKFKDCDKEHHSLEESRCQKQFVIFKHES